MEGNTVYKVEFEYLGSLRQLILCVFSISTVLSSSSFIQLYFILSEENKENKKGGKKPFQLIGLSWWKFFFPAFASSSSASSEKAKSRRMEKKNQLLLWLSRIKVKAKRNLRPEQISGFFSRFTRAFRERRNERDRERKKTTGANLLRNNKKR